MECDRIAGDARMRQNENGLVLKEVLMVFRIQLNNGTMGG